MTHETSTPKPPAPLRRASRGRGGALFEALFRATRDPELAYTALLEVAEMASENLVMQFRSEILVLAGKVESLTEMVRGLAERLTATEARWEERFRASEARTDARFDRLEESIASLRRMLIGGLITLLITLLAVILSAFLVVALGP